MKKTFAFALLLVSAACLQAQGPEVGSTRAAFNDKGMETLIPADTGKAPMDLQPPASTLMPPAPSGKGISPKALAQVIEEFSGKRVSMPYQIVNSANKLHAEMLRLKEKTYAALAETTKAFAGVSTGNAYKNVAEKAGALAEALDGLAKHRLTKNVEVNLSDLHEMLELKAAKCLLMAKKLSALSKQAKSPQVAATLQKLARHHLEMSQNLSAALAQVYDEEGEVQTYGSVHPTPGEHTTIL